MVFNSSSFTNLYLLLLKSWNFFNLVYFINHLPVTLLFRLFLNNFSFQSSVNYPTLFLLNLGFIHVYCCPIKIVFWNFRIVIQHSPLVMLFWSYRLCQSWVVLTVLNYSIVFFGKVFCLHYLAFFYRLSIDFSVSLINSLRVSTWCLLTLTNFIYRLKIIEICIRVRLVLLILTTRFSRSEWRRFWFFSIDTFGWCLPYTKRRLLASLWLLPLIALLYRWVFWTQTKVFFYGLTCYLFITFFPPLSWLVSSIDKILIFVLNFLSFWQNKLSIWLIIEFWFR